MTDKKNSDTNRKETETGCLMKMFYQIRVWMSSFFGTERRSYMN